MRFNFGTKTLQDSIGLKQGAGGGSHVEKGFGLFAFGSPNKASSHSRVFGQPLAALVAKEVSTSKKSLPVGELPKILVKLVSYLTIDTAIRSEGLFRVEGGSKRTKDLREALDKSMSYRSRSCSVTSEDVEMTVADISSDTIYAMASILKQFVREIPDGLVPEKLYGDFLKAADNPQGLEDAVDQLEDENYYVLRYVLLLLLRVDFYHRHNKMTLATLALVFGPNIFRAPSMATANDISNSSQGMDLLKENMKISSVILALTEHFHEIFLSVEPLTDHERIIALGLPKLGQIAMDRENTSATSSQQSLDKGKSKTASPSTNATHQSVIDDLKQRFEKGQERVLPVTPHPETLKPAELIALVQTSPTAAKHSSKEYTSTKMVFVQPPIVPEKDDVSADSPRLLSSLTKLRARLPKHRTPSQQGRPISTKKATAPALEKLITDSISESRQSLNGSQPRGIIKGSNGSLNSPSKSVRFSLPHEQFVATIQAATTQNNAPEEKQKEDEENEEEEEEDSLHSETLTSDTPSFNEPIQQANELISQTSGVIAVATSTETTEEDVSEESDLGDYGNHDDTGSFIEKDTADEKVEPFKITILNQPGKMNTLDQSTVQAVNNTTEPTHTMKQESIVARPAQEITKKADTYPFGGSIVAQVLDKKISDRMEKLHELETLLRTPIEAQHPASRHMEELPTRFVSSKPPGSTPTSQVHDTSVEEALGLPTRYIVSSSPVPTPAISEQANKMSQSRQLLGTNGKAVSSSNSLSLSALDMFRRSGSSSSSSSSTSSTLKPPRKSKLKQRFASLSAVNEHKETSDFRSEFEKRRQEKLTVDTSRFRKEELPLPSAAASLPSAPAPELEVATPSVGEDELPELTPIDIPSIPSSQLSHASRSSLDQKFHQLYRALKYHQTFLRQIKPFLVKEDPDYELKLEFYQGLHRAYKMAAQNYGQVKTYLSNEQMVSDKRLSLELQRPNSAVSERPTTPTDPKAEKHLLKKEIQRLKSTLSRLQELENSTEIQRQVREITLALVSYHARYQELKDSTSSPVSPRRSGVAIA